MRTNKKKTKWRLGAKIYPICPKGWEKRNPTATIAPPMFPELFQRDIHLNRSTPILLITKKRLIQTNPARELVNRVNCAARRKKKQKRWRSVWEERYICTNTKNSKNAEIHANVLKELDQRHEDGSFPFCVDQLRNKFKKCISECWKIALTVKTSTGVKRVQDEKQLGAWFNQLFPLVQTRDSCNPDMAVESSSSLQLSDGEPVKRASDNRTPTDEQSSDGLDQGDDSDKKQFVPIRKGRRKKVKSQNSSSALSTAVELFEKVVNNDPTTQLIYFFKEENQRALEHELKLMELFMSQRQPAASYSAGSSSMIFQERSPGPFAGSSYRAGSSSMISPQRSPSHLHIQLKIYSTRNFDSASSQRVDGKGITSWRKMLQSGH